MTIVGGDTRRAQDPSPQAVPVHRPVMVAEVLSAFAAEGSGLLAPLAPLANGWLVDGTLGAGGHARALLERFPGLRLLGVDQDPEVLAHARETLAAFGDRARLCRGRMSSLGDLVEDLGDEPVVGVFFDLGANSLHFDSPERGFSFQADGPLDMRMDPDRERTAADIVNRWDEADLADLFYHEGGERRSRAIARAIVTARRRVPFQRTSALAELIVQATGGRAEARIHPATRTFQALRRAVNEEGEELLRGLEFAERHLVEGGRLVVLSFHSGEDGMVKRTLAEGARRGVWRLPSRKPIQPSHGEVRANPRARSTRLRVGLRLGSGRPPAEEGSR